MTEEKKMGKGYGENDVLTIEQVGDFMHIGRSTVWKMIKQEGLPSFKVGRRRLVQVRSLNEWIENRMD